MPPCSRTPCSRELSKGCFGSHPPHHAPLLVELPVLESSPEVVVALFFLPLHKGASATSVDNRSQESALERTVLGFSHPPHHASLVVELLVLESSPKVALARFSSGPFSKGSISCISGQQEPGRNSRTQCSRDLPPSPPCPPCCRTPGSRELSEGFIGLVCACLLFLVGHQLRQLPAFLC